MKVRIRSRALAALCLLCLVAAACKEGPVKQAAKGFTIAAHTLGNLQDTVIEAHSKGLMTEANTRSVLQASVKINEAGLRGTAVLRTLNDQIGLPEQQQVLAVIDLVLKELTALQASLNIKDPNTSSAVLGAISSIQATMNSTRLIIAAIAPQPANPPVTGGTIQ